MEKHAARDICKSPHSDPITGKGESIAPTVLMEKSTTMIDGKDSSTFADPGHEGGLLRRLPTWMKFPRNAPTDLDAPSYGLGVHRDRRISDAVCTERSR